MSIAFVRDGIVEIGFVYSPARDELFVGRRGAGATLNGAPIRVSMPARPRATASSASATRRASAPTHSCRCSTRLLAAGGMFYRDGSGALGLCYVACGRLIGYVEPHINSWDCLGALAVIEAAGGRRSDFLAGDGLLAGNRLSPGRRVCTRRWRRCLRSRARRRGGRRHAPAAVRQHLGRRSA